MSERFFVETPIAGDRAELAGTEAHHLARVMRASVGDRVLLFDGSGSEFTARVDLLKKDRVELTILQRQAVDRELARSVTLAVALPKGERQKWLLEKLVELGVARLVPLITERGVAQPVEQVLARLARNVIEASKQCGRNRLLAIAPPLTAADYFAAAAATDVRLLAHPTGQPLRAAIPPADSINLALPAPLHIAIGPEGGFTDSEIAAARAHGWLPISLGARILRIETAALALAAWAALGE
jgi:16S rRNA (uracil1498-N3)-methyltransferase